jgi:hypothetical protein
MWEGALAPGAHPPIDLLTFLKHVPERWAPWKTLCKEVRRLQRELYFGLLTEMEGRLEKGQENGCYMEEIASRQKEFGLTREQMGSAHVRLFEIGNSTTYILPGIWAELYWRAVQTRLLPSFSLSSLCLSHFLRWRTKHERRSIVSLVPRGRRQLTIGRIYHIFR